MLFVLQNQANTKTFELRKTVKNGMNGIIFFSAKFFVSLSTLSPAHRFAIKERLQRREGDIRGTSKTPIFQLFSELGKI